MLRIEWSTAAVLITVVVALAAVVLAGPAAGLSESAQEQVLAGVGALGALVLAAMKALLGKDADGNGTPDILERGREDAAEEGE